MVSGSSRATEKHIFRPPNKPTHVLSRLSVRNISSLLGKTLKMYANDTEGIHSVNNRGIDFCVQKVESDLSSVPKVA